MSRAAAAARAPAARARAEAVLVAAGFTAALAGRDTVVLPVWALRTDDLAGGLAGL
jgi:hypothetical protein